VCSYCGCRALTVIGRLSEEHEAINDVAGELRRAAQHGDTAGVRERAAALTALVRPHTGSEERGLFSELREDPEFTPYVDALCAEHEEIDALLDKVSGGSLEAATDLEARLRRHIDREENGLFPAAAVALDGPAWERVSARS